MPTAKKEANVAELRELVERSTIMIGAEYRGLSVKEMTTLRRTLRDAGVEARVVKNRLFKLAAAQAGVEAAAGVAEGPSLVIFGFGDVVSPSKAIADYVRTARNAFAPKKAYMDGAVVEGSVITELASLPSREELIASPSSSSPSC
jgi:large subunit ribosomal protein L10